MFWILNHGLFSALLHWLKELNFVPPDASPFAQLIQNLSLVNASSSSASLAAYVQAKRREGVLAHIPSHVGIHFRKDLAASSFAGPFLFDDEVLTRIIASSCEDSHLDAQLSIVKAFKLPVFLGAGNANRKASSNQCSEASTSSSSGPRGRGGSNSEDKGAKRKAPPSPKKGWSSKAPRRSASPGKGKGNFRKWEPCPCPAVVGGCLSSHWPAWEDRGAEPWVVEVVREGYVIPFHSVPPLSATPIILDSYSPQSIKGRALEEEIQALRLKGAVEPASPSPGYYSRMFVVTKTSGGWRPIIDLPTLNLSVVVSKFRMETAQSVLRSVRRGDWMVSVDLKDACLQIPIHPQSRKFLRFTAGGRAWQFKVLCFSLSTAPQVFTRVMAPVSGFLHRLGVRMLRYLDDWLIMASSQDEACWARDKVLQLCQELGIVVNLDKSFLTPSQVIVYLGIKIESQTFRASPTPSRIEKFFLIVEEILSLKVQSAKFWRVLLGHLTPLMHLVTGGQLRMRSLQIALKRG